MKYNLVFELTDSAIENFETETIRELEINSKALQISPKVLRKCTQTSLGFGKDMATQTEDEHREKVNTGTQSDLENHDDQLLTEEATLEAESDISSEDLYDSFHMNRQSESEHFENEDDADKYCSANAIIEKLTRKGSAILVQLKCVRGHINLWISQSLLRSYYQGNIRMAASVLFISNTFEKMKKHFELAAIPFASKSSFYRIQGKYLFGVTNEVWLNEQGGILNAVKK